MDNPIRTIIKVKVEKLPRAYIANLIYTIIGDPFKQWVQQQIHNRTEKIKEEQEDDGDVEGVGDDRLPLSTSRRLSNTRMKSIALGYGKCSKF